MEKEFHYRLMQPFCKYSSTPGHMSCQSTKLSTLVRTFVRTFAICVSRSIAASSIIIAKCSESDELSLSLCGQNPTRGKRLRRGKRREGRKVAAVSTVAGKEGSVINFNAVSINHSDTNTHKRRRRRRRRTATGGGGTRGIERGRRGGRQQG